MVLNDCAEALIPGMVVALAAPAEQNVVNSDSVIVIIIIIIGGSSGHCCTNRSGIGVFVYVFFLFYAGMFDG